MALPALWAGGEPPRIVGTLLDALGEMLRLAFVLVRLKDPDGGPSVEMMRVGLPLAGVARARELGAVIDTSLGKDPSGWPPGPRVVIEGVELAVASARLGLDGEIGIVVAGSQRLDFPEQTERLLLDVAANQATVGLQQARLLGEQRRLAKALDERVAQRTSELAAANEALKEEVAERRRAEEALRQAEREARSIVDNIPGLVGLLSPTGDVDVVNRHLLEYFGQTLEELRQWGTNGTGHPEDLPHVGEVFTRSIESGSPYRIVQRLRRSDGVYRWFENSGCALRDATGRIVRRCVLLTDIDELKRAEVALKRSERDLQLIIDTIPALAWSTGPDGSADFFNQHYLDFVGLLGEQVAGWGWTFSVHPDDRDGLANTWERIMAAGEPGEAEARLRRYDGEYRWFLFRVNPLRDEQGRIVKWYGVNTDIEERRWVETQLAGEKRLLEMIASGRPLSDVLNALCSFVEDAAPECHCGVYPIDWSGATFQVGAAPSLPASYTAPVEGLPVRCDVAPCGEAAHLKTQVIVEDLASDPRWHASPYREHVLAHGLRSVWSTPIYSLEGRVLGTFCVYQRDPARPSPRQHELIAQVTHIASIAMERAEGEAALKRSEALLAEGQRLSMTGTFWWRTATDEIKWSDESCRILEVDPAVPATFELIDTRIHPEDASAFKARVERARTEGDDFGCECRLLMPDRSVKYLHVVAHATRVRSGQLEYFGAIQDVTERRRSQDALSKLHSELAHAARVTSLGALTASIAHEVNQPLAGIVTNASTCLRMLSADVPDVEGARETARRTIRDANRASAVITRLRALFGKREFTLGSVDLNDATREVIALSLSDLQRSRVLLRSELADDLPTVTGDRVQLQQVILNLLRNAVDAMDGVHDRPRQLVVRTEREDGGRARVTVRDAGVGIARQSLDRLFDPFYTTKSGGMGIGLSVSRSIVERHHGRLWAEPNDGPGASFAFSIPCAPEGAPDVAVVAPFAWPW